MTSLDVVRTIITTAVYADDGASLDDIAAAFPPAADRADIKDRVDDLVSRQLLEFDPAKRRYFATQAAAPYLPIAIPPTPEAAAPRPPKRIRPKAPAPTRTAVDEAKPVIAAVVKQAVEATSQSATPPAAAPTAGASPKNAALASAVADLAARSLSEVASNREPRERLLRIVLAAAAVLLGIAVLQLTGRSPWLTAGVALLVIVAGIAIQRLGVFSTSEAAAASASAASTTPGADTSTSATARPRRWIAGVVAAGCVIATVGILVASWYLRHSREPSASEVSAYLATTLAPIPVRVTNLDLTLASSGSTTCRVSFTAIVETTEPLYEPVNATEYLRTKAPAEMAAIEPASRLLQGPGADRIRRRLATTSDQRSATAPASDKSATLAAGAFPAGADDVAARQAEAPATSTAIWPAASQDTQNTQPSHFELFMRSTLLTARTPPGTAIGYSGVLLAWRRDGTWAFSLETNRIDRERLAGMPRSSSRGAFLLDSPDDIARLLASVREAARYAEAVQAAARAVAGEVAEARQGRVEPYAHGFRAGVLFEGTARDPIRGEAHRVVLEIVDNSARSGKVNAAIHNDGGWGDARTFRGDWSVSGAGDDETCLLTLRTQRDDRVPDGGPLLEEDAEWSVVLTVTADGHATTASRGWDLRRVEGEVAMADLKRALSRPVAEALSATKSGLCYRGSAIRKLGGGAVPVVLRFTQQDAEQSLLRAMLESTGGSLGRPFAGAVIDNTYRAGRNPIRLRSNDSERVIGADRRSPFGIDTSSNQLVIELRVESGRLVGEDRWFTYLLEPVEPSEVAPARGPSLPGSESEAGTIAATRAARPESRAAPALSPREPAGSTTSAHTSGRPIEPSVALVADSSAASGGLPPYPTAAGVYVLSKGQWQVLKPAETHRSATKAAVVEGAANLLRKFSTATGTWTAGVNADAALSQVLSGRGAVPAVAAGTIVIAAVQANGAVSLQTDSGLARAPAIELAAAHQAADGTRTALMVPVSPGVLGFGPAALTGSLSQPTPGVSLLTCPNVRPGRYAVHVGEALYEVAVE